MLWLLLHRWLGPAQARETTCGVVVVIRRADWQTSNDVLDEERIWASCKLDYLRRLPLALDATRL